MKIADALKYTQGGLLKEQANRFGDKPLYYFRDQKVSYQQFDKKTDIIARGLEKLGVEKSDRVGILLPNSHEILESYYGIWKSGGISVSINPMYTEREIEYIINNSEARYIITSDIFLPRIEAAKPNMSSLEGVIMVSREAIPDTIPYSQIAEGAERIGDKGITPDDAALILYTSGTTGNPKGAVLPQNGAIVTVGICADLGYYTEDDCSLIALPFFHGFAILAFLMNVAGGGKGQVIHERFDPEATLRDFGKYGVSVYVGVPTMYSSLLDTFDPSKHDVTSMRLGITGAAPVPPHVMRSIEEKFGMTIIELYGLTESCGAITIERLDRERRIGSCGHSLPGMEVKIVDENGNEVPHGEVGEIIMRGPTTMQGYWKMPEANAETLRNGWLHTKDMARRDEDGYYYITDRLSDMIITGGFNIYPKEIENVLYTHPAVLEASVIGVPDAVKGEIAKAYLVLKEGEKTTEDEFDTFCRQSLAAYKVPRIYEIRNEPLPKNQQGKILKRVLRNKLKSQT